MAPVFAVAASVLDSRDREVVVQSRRVIFLRVGRIVRRAHWTTGTLLDLQVMLLKAFDAPPELAMLRAKSALSAPYVLTHSTFASGYVDASPLLWPDVDLREGSVVSVKDPLWQAVCTLCSSSVGGERRAPRLSAIADDASSSAAGGIDEGATARAKLEADAAQHGDMPPSVLATIRRKAKQVESQSNLNFRDRVDLLLNEPTSSVAATAIGVLVLVLIVLSTVTFCVETIPWLYDPNPPLTSAFWVIECCCIILFTAEFSARAWATPDPRAFWRSYMNLIDFVAILPFYIDLAARGIEVPGLSVLRVLRLARVFRLLKVSKDSVALLSDTMWRSARPLNILGFLLAISIVMFSAVLYYTERGRFDEHQGRWIRTVGFDCEIACGPETNKLAHAFLACDDASADSTETQTMFFARHKFTTPGIDESDACVRVEEHSPFQSILHAVWWAVVTMATTGYGDMYPRGVWGMLLASLCQMCGLLVIALPVTVIGSNFSTIYASLGSSQLTDATSHHPTESVAPSRLHAGSQGATARPVTNYWLTPLTQAWDIDVAYKELLPCKPPTKISQTNVMSRRSAKEEFDAFLKGDDMLVKAKKKKGDDASPPAKAKEKGGQSTNREKLLRVTAEEIVAETPKGKTFGKTPSKKERMSVGHQLNSPTFKAFATAKRVKKPAQARISALVSLTRSGLATAEANEQIKDKFAAERNRKALAPVDDMFVTPKTLKNEGGLRSAASVKSSAPLASPSRRSFDR